MASPMPPASIQAPPGAVNAGPAPAIFTMPERYRNGSVGTDLVQPAAEAPKVPLPKPLPPPPPLPPKPVPAAPLHGKPHGKITLLVGIPVLLLLGIGGFFAFRAATRAPATSTNTEPTPSPLPAEPIVVPTPPAAPVVPATEPPFPTGVHPGTDSDSDGLTDIEEQVLYLTDVHLPDSDSDGFLDGNEVFHLYNPNALAPGTLVAAGLAKSYVLSAAAGAPALPYSLDYPSVWSVRAQEADPQSAVFAATTGETVTLSVQKKMTPDQTLDAWYAAQNLPVARVSLTKGGIHTLVSDDQLTVYVDAKTNVLIFHYDVGIKGTVDYLQTFKMMLNSLKIL